MHPARCKKMPPKRATWVEAVRDFRERGPYTFATTWELAQRCRSTDAGLLHNALDSISHKFPLPEFIKLLDFSTTPPNSDVEHIWSIGTITWSLRYLNQEHSDEQLQEIAKHPRLLQGILERAPSSKVPGVAIFHFLRVVRSTCGKKSAAVLRDASPTRV